jgi:hypothetical protein
MNMMSQLSEVTDQFFMELGAGALQDIDTPSFMRKEYGVELDDAGMSSSSGRIVEPDEKIVRFLSVIKRRNFAMGA